MNRFARLALKAVLVLALPAGCATTSGANGTPQASACFAQEVQNPGAQVARGNAPLRELGAGARNPSPQQFWGLAGADTRSARVVNPADPEVARGNRTADCSVMLAQANR
jgi:hypothetical protein